ncbi:uncharacterized protein LOC133201694 [Saccostrea echinata]|uniref:uncharacterized protein LOC133201694 n=1 Tax=Saccostrea echinata TaxID=191078 RepID=UPI002A83CB62|nr:uncharacterized protein LOC133201694 [Saccostrea echinata]
MELFILKCVYIIFNHVSLIREINCQLCTGLDRCCFGYRWNEHLQSCTKCSVGFYGNECSKKCKYPYYGEDCQHVCNCESETCDFTFGCKNETATDVFFEVDTSNQTTIDRRRINYVSFTDEPRRNFEILFLICASLLGFCLILNTLCLVLFLRRKYKKKILKKGEEYEVMGDIPHYIYSSLNTEEVNPCLEASAVGQIKLLKYKDDNKFSIEIKTTPFELNQTSCSLNSVGVSNETTQIQDRQREFVLSSVNSNPYVEEASEENQQPNEYSSLDNI